MNRKPTLLLLPPLALLTLLLSACPAAETPAAGPMPDTEQPKPGPTVTQAGVVTFTEISIGLGDPLRLSTANFFSTPAAPAGDYMVNGVEDTCAVLGAASAAEPPANDPGSIEFLDAGEQITATAGGETYAVLEKYEDSGDVFYGSGLEQLPPLPASTFTVTVPGAAFPAFSAHVPGAGAAPEFGSPVDLSSITPSSTFSWTPAPEAATTATATYLLLIISQQLNSGDSVDVACVLQDDGSFSFSPETRADMKTNGFTNGSLFLSSRAALRTEVSGDAALILSVEKDAFYNDAAQPLTAARTASLRRELKRLQERVQLHYLNLRYSDLHRKLPRQLSLIRHDRTPETVFEISSGGQGHCNGLWFGSGPYPHRFGGHLVVRGVKPLDGQPVGFRNRGQAQIEFERSFVLLERTLV